MRSCFIGTSGLGYRTPAITTGGNMALVLTSNNFTEGAALPMDHILSADFGFGCSGGTKSFALHCFDPDAPTGSGFWHWVVVNIPADVSELKLDAGNAKSGLLPKGALQTRTDFGTPGYGGPCPPEGLGAHRYQFTLFAVKQESLPVNVDTSAAVIGFQLFFNTLEKVTLTGKVER